MELEDGRYLLLERKVTTNLDSILKGRDITLPTKVHLAKGMVFPAVMYGCESWTIKKAECQRIDAFELWHWRRLSRVPETQQIHPKGNQSWIFNGRTDAEAEIPVFWPPDVKNGLILKDPDAGKDWKLEEKGTTEDEMVGWHHRLYGHEFEQALRVDDGQGSLACCSPWDHKESDMTVRLNLLRTYRLPRWLNREGNGTPLQYSCLENPMNGGAWWAAVHGVAQSRTWLKRLSSSSSRWLKC